ncbi:MAG: ribonuclease D [Proteobacteria bacterium]|nr:ribonuclease D [Pseudomonadota bacterium]
MSPIADNAELAALCHRLSNAPFVAIDTEFLRDKTYWPLLCLVQLAGPEEAHAIDALAPGIDLAPLLELLRAADVVKVFHAARQDVEIFFHMTGEVPSPIFDSQVAAMVCGFGDQVSYETLAGKLTGARIDKSSRFTDWSRRPLTERQLGYALADVTYLRTIYDKLSLRMAESGRAAWLAEELAVLRNPETYRLEPSHAWRRLKPRSSNPRFLAMLASLAAWREVEAQRRNVPRQRIVRDEVLLEVAAQAPANVADLARCRLIPTGFAESRLGQDMLTAIAEGRDRPPPAITEGERPSVPPGRQPLVELLKVLLKLQCETHEVAQKLVASAEDLEAIAAVDDAAVPALTGWRRAVFGDYALALKRGRIALTGQGGRLQLVRLKPTETT